MKVKKKGVQRPSKSIIKKRERKVQWIIILLLILLPLIIALISMLYKATVQRLETAQASNAPYTKGQLIVKFTRGYSDSSIDSYLESFHAKRKGRIEQLNYDIISVPSGHEQRIQTELLKDNAIAEAELDYITTISYTPNDASFSSLQWGLDNTGQDINGQTGTAKADVNIKPAWDTTKGDGIKVAILDTGIDSSHPDLAGKVAGSQFFITTSVEDQHGHGTHVAGIIAANTNNQEGIAGTCPGCLLLIGKVQGDNGEGSNSTVAQGIVWAADSGAKVINMSIGNNTSSQIVIDAVAYAWGKGALLVAAAGNDNSSALHYPSAYANVVSVAATTNQDTKASFSNYGSWVQVTAPGDDIYSTLPTYPYFLQTAKGLQLTYDFLDGTSMSTPIVSGVAALVWASQYGTSNASVADRLYKTADKIQGTGTYWINGRINAAQAVGVPPPTPTPEATATPTPIAPTFYCLKLGEGDCQQQ